MDVEKTFDLLDHNFLISVLKKFAFSQNFITWIEIVLKNQESCLINGRTNTKYFKISQGARRGDPISAYLFIWLLKFYLLLLKKILV